MAKKVIKEIGIVILLLIAVSLLLAILFYDYIPNNKTVPIKIEAYTVPEDIEQELQDSIAGEQNIVRTYYIDSSDLDLYESTNDYNKGKANPFADYTIEETDTTNTTQDNIKDNNNNGNATSDKNINSNDAQSNVQDDTNKNEVYINTPGKNY